MKKNIFERKSDKIKMKNKSAEIFKKQNDRNNKKED